jgi:glutamyl-tRNA reductase
VRTETEIGSSSVSIASVAVDLARRIFGSLEGKKILIVGAGKMSELAARHLMEHGADSIMVANRTYDRAIRLAEQFMGQAIRFEELPARAHEADIIITSTGSPEKILGVEQAQAILHRRKGQPVFVIDIAVPRDVDPQVNRLEGMFVYDIDDLQQVAAAHLVDRGRETTKAETIIAEETERFRRRIRTIDIAPVLVDVQGTAEELRQAELHRQRVLLQSLSAEQQEAVEALTRGLMNKFMHIPLQAMKAAARDGDAAALETIRGMFEKECGHKVDGGTTRGRDETGESEENEEPGLKP